MCDKINYLEQPLTREEIKYMADEKNYISKNIAITLSEIIGNDIEDFLDLISIKLCGNTFLIDINYELVGCIIEKHLIILNISGDISGIID